MNEIEYILTVETLKRLLQDIPDDFPVSGLITNGGYGGNVYYEEGKVRIDKDDKRCLIVIEE